MIPEQTICTTISNQGSYYRKLGYNVKQGNIIQVDIKDLMLNSNKKVIFICDECNIQGSRQYQILNKSKLKAGKHFCYACARIHVEQIKDRTNIDLATKSRVGSKHPRWNPSKTAFKKYAYQVRRYTYTHFEKELKEMISDTKIGPCGTSGAFQVDHKIAINYGFRNNLPIEKIGHINNLQIIPWEQNLAKSDSFEINN